MKVILKLLKVVLKAMIKLNIFGWLGFAEDHSLLDIEGLDF